MVFSENRSGAYFWVREHRKRRKRPFAGRSHLNLNRSEKKAGKGMTPRRPASPARRPVSRIRTIPSERNRPSSPLPITAQRRGKAHKRKELGPVPKRVGSSGGSGNLHDLV